MGYEKMKFNKLPKTFDEQLDILIERGLLVEDRVQAVHYLTHLNYYRLEAYWLPFEISHAPHQFKQGTQFTDIINHYIFDRELRILLLDAIERIEVSLRTQWAYHITHAFGPHGYLINTKGLIKNEQKFIKDKQDLTDHIQRSTEIFVKHFHKKYTEELPPAWVSCEVMSLGLLSRFYSNLRAHKVRRAISNTYGLDEAFMEGFMEHLTYIRNVCAHHSRLWDQYLTKVMPLPKNKPLGLRENINEHTEHNIYNTLALIIYLLPIICIETHWANRLINLIEKHHIDTKKMGFPDNWRALPLWSKYN